VHIAIQLRERENEKVKEIEKRVRKEKE